MAWSRLGPKIMPLCNATLVYKTDCLQYADRLTCQRQQQHTPYTSLKRNATQRNAKSTPGQM